MSLEWSLRKFPSYLLFRNHSWEQWWQSTNDESGKCEIRIQRQTTIAHILCHTMRVQHNIQKRFERTRKEIRCSLGELLKIVYDSLIGVVELGSRFLSTTAKSYGSPSIDRECVLSIVLETTRWYNSWDTSKHCSQRSCDTAKPEIEQARQKAKDITLQHCRETVSSFLAIRIESKDLEIKMIVSAVTQPRTRILLGYISWEYESTVDIWTRFDVFWIDVFFFLFFTTFDFDFVLKPFDFLKLSW